MPELAPPPDAAPVLAQEFKVPGACSVQIDVPQVRARLRPSPAPDRVSVDLTVTNAPEESAETVVEQMGLRTRQVEGAIRIISANTARTSDWWRWIRNTTARVYLDVRVPSPVEASARVPGGTLVLSGLEGSFDLAVPGGAVRLQNLAGPIALRAPRSRAELQALEGPRLVVESAAAPVTLSDIASDQVTVTSRGGTLTVRSVQGTCRVSTHATPVTFSGLSGPCRATARGGRLTFAGALQADTELTTVGAPLTAELASSTGAALDATATSLTMDDSLSFEGTRDGTRLRGTLNGGGAALSLRAIQAPVHLNAS